MNAERIDVALRLISSGRPAQAEPILRDALASDPHDADALHFLGLLRHRQGRHAEALDLLRRSVERAPAAAHFRSNLAGVLGQLGLHAEALAHLREVVRAQPTLPQGHNNLGVALESIGQLDEAAAALSEALRLHPAYPEAHNNLGNVFLKRRAPADAARCYRAALSHRPDYPQAHQNLAIALSDLGRADEAVEHYRKAVDLRPDSARLGSDYLYALHYLRGDEPRAMFEAHEAWADRHARPLYPPGETRYRPPPSRNRPLRVGYVSPDFRSHPVSRFFEPILQHHDRQRFDVFCYSGVARPDAVTQRLHSYPGITWRQTCGLSDDALADGIRADNIDILVDLTGHMAGSRLLVFARKPAPVQVSFLGYPNTTGVATIDYRITDAVQDPPGETDAFHTERLIRLNRCCWAYRPDADSPDVNELPAPARGHVTFACLNKLVKVTPRMIALWARILSAVPRSRLMVLAGGAGSSAADLFATGGIAPDRVQFVPRLPRDPYLRLYHGIDLALDTFPYNGHTTTCDALWMGVPTITLAGTTHVSRAGLNVLTRVGLAELAANDADAYVDAAVSLASDLPRLAAHRTRLREAMSGSVLTDGIGLTRSLEAQFVRFLSEAVGP